MPVQTAYSTNHTGATIGAPVDGQLRNVRSFVAEVAIPFGRAVSRGASAGGAKLPTGAGDVSGFVGVSMRVQDDVENAAGLLQYEIGRNVSVIDFGMVYVQVENAVTAGGGVFVRHAAGAGGTALGAFRGNADAGTATGLNFALFEASGSAGAIVPIRFLAF